MEPVLKGQKMKGQPFTSLVIEEWNAYDQYAALIDRVTQLKMVKESIFLHALCCCVVFHIPVVNS